MSEKVDVRGDVAQLIGGNINEAPRQNNVVNFHMGGEKTPVETLTDLQRKRINGLIKDLCTITQEKPLDIYRVILTDFGAERMKDMPRARYREIVALLERWISENGQGLAKAEAAINGKENGGAQKSVGLQFHRCNSCTTKDVSYARLQLVSRCQWMLVALLAIACSLQMFEIGPNVFSAKASTISGCLYDGKIYSLGSFIGHSEGVVRECIVDGEAGGPLWARPR